MHLPFCSTVCYYCACNKVITKNRARAQPYLNALEREVELQGSMFESKREIQQLHWGGGTPTFFDDRQMSGLMARTDRHFHLLGDDQGEYSIEIDPREANADTILHLRSLGFNRISLGVQDFDPRVQAAVNRIQSLQQTEVVVTAARSCGFKSLNIDLIYGLPLQTVSSFAKTLETVITRIRPDRISVFNYAHLPDRFKTQRQINSADLPSATEKLDILQYTIQAMTDAGYVYIGMDHFALPEDELAQAQQQGRLHRNFQGYATHADCDLVGLGVSAIGQVANCYYQNFHAIDDYVEAINAGRLAIFRGVMLNRDDEIRRAVIKEIICHRYVEFADIESRFSIVFAEYFATELAALRALAADGLIRMQEQSLQLTPAGRLLVRNVCMQFDLYRREQKDEGRFSRAI